MRRFGVAFAAALLVSLLTFAGTAAADIEWCAEDPAFSVLGGQFAITTSIQAPASAVTLIKYVVHVPRNAGAVTVSYPDGKPIPTTVAVRHDQPTYSGSGSFTVRVSISVKLREDGDFDNVAVRADLAGRSVTAATFVGTADEPLSFSFPVAP